MVMNQAHGVGDFDKRRDNSSDPAAQNLPSGLSSSFSHRKSLLPHAQPSTPWTGGYRCQKCQNCPCTSTQAMLCTTDPETGSNLSPHSSTQMQTESLTNLFSSHHASLLEIHEPQTMPAFTQPGEQGAEELARRDNHFTTATVDHLALQIPSKQTTMVLGPLQQLKQRWRTLEH